MIENQLYSVNSKRLSLYGQLFLYGDFIPLDFYIDPEQCKNELQPFEADWKPYQPLKGHTGREGLSLTSLDGSLSGYPELQSLYEYSRDTGKTISENDFNVFTPLYDQVRSIRELVDYFKPYMGRSRFVRFQAGEHFPPHRDQSVSFQVPDYFRLFIPLAGSGENKLFFLYDGKVMNYEPGRVYLFNAMKVHTVFSVQPGALTLALSLKLDQNAIMLAIKRLYVR